MCRWVFSQVRRVGCSFLPAVFVLASAVLFSDVWQITRKDLSKVANSDKPVIIDISASWCSSCQAMAPIIAEAVQAYPQIQFAKIDASSERGLVRHFRITGLPTLLFFKPGQQEPVMRHTGVLSQEALNEKIDQFLKSK